MKIGDEVIYKENKKYSTPYYGDKGLIKNMSKNNTAALVEFDYGNVWCMCCSLEVIE